MKASRFSDAQKAFILKQGADGMPVADVCRKAGISQATYFNWKKKYDGLLPTEMRRLKQLEDENSKLKRIVADLSLDKEMLQDAIRRSSETYPEAQAGRRDAWRVGCFDPPGLRRVRDGHLDLPLQISPPRTGPPRTTEKGDLPDAHSLWLSADSCLAEARGLSSRPEQDPPH